jgi:hypothetical protein
VLIQFLDEYSRINSVMEVAQNLFRDTCLDICRSIRKIDQSFLSKLVNNALKNEIYLHMKEITEKVHFF